MSQQEKQDSQVFLNERDKQFGDSLSVYEIQYPNLNTYCIDEWAEKLGIKDLWERFKREAVISEK